MPLRPVYLRPVRESMISTESHRGGSASVERQKFVHTGTKIYDVLLSVKVSAWNYGSECHISDFIFMF